MLKILQLMSEFCINFDTYLFVITRKKTCPLLESLSPINYQAVSNQPLPTARNSHAGGFKVGWLRECLRKKRQPPNWCHKTPTLQLIDGMNFEPCPFRNGGKEIHFQTWKLAVTFSACDTMRYTWFVCNLLCILTFLYHIKLTQIIKKQSSCFFILYFQIQSWVFPLTRAFPHVATFTVCATSVG